MTDIHKDHPDQAVDTAVPREDFVDEATWEAMRDAALEDEELPDE